MTLKDKFKHEKPWAIMGTDKASYVKARPWKAFPKGRVWFERELLPTLPPELFKELWDINDAEKLAEAIFGKPKE